MIRVGALVWSLLAALLITALSLFYIQNGVNGYPLSITYYEGETVGHQEAAEEETVAAPVENRIKRFSWTTFAADTLFWWVIFSILLVVVKNYAFDSYPEKPKKEQESENTKI